MTLVCGRKVSKCIITLLTISHLFTSEDTINVCVLDLVHARETPVMNEALNAPFAVEEVKRKSCLVSVTSHLGLVVYKHYRKKAYQ
jgi:hypothetical protein